MHQTYALPSSQFVMMGKQAVPVIPVVLMDPRQLSLLQNPVVVGYN